MDNGQFYQIPKDAVRFNPITGQQRSFSEVLEDPYAKIIEEAFDENLVRDFLTADITNIAQTGVKVKRYAAKHFDSDVEKAMDHLFQEASKRRLQMIDFANSLLVWLGVELKQMDIDLTKILFNNPDTTDSQVKSPLYHITVEEMSRLMPDHLEYDLSDKSLLNAFNSGQTSTDGLRNVAYLVKKSLE